MNEARRQQLIEELAAASARALAAKAHLRFRGHRLHHHGRPLPALAPHLQPSLDDDDFGSFRGAADGVALRLARSDLALHRALRPDGVVERVVFDLLEQFRVESLAPAAMPGVARNLRHRHEQWCLAAQRDGLTDSAGGLLLYTVAQVARARLTGEPVIEVTEGLIESTRMALGPAIGHALAALRRTRADQAAYADHALAIARIVGARVHDAAAPPGGARGGDEADAAARSLGRLLAFDDIGSDALPTAGPETARTPCDEAARDYRVHTTAYDVEHRAASLVRAALLQEYRGRLDAGIAAYGVSLPRLARQAKDLLAAPQPDGWEGAQEAGRIDGRRLAQLVATPTERRLFRTEHEQPSVDCVVAFLIDCSGSMKQHVEWVAPVVDVLVRVLEQAGAMTEVLGFTTGAWNGGRARRDWLRAGSPVLPGRLNEVCHLVFKDAETPWRRARRDIAALLKVDLFREGVDGEAVAWACARLRTRSEARKVLVVVSDGSPMDGATALSNGEHYLDDHLRAVVERHERCGDIALRALGVGLDLTPYYRRCLALDATAPPDGRMLSEILRLVGGRN